MILSLAWRVEGQFYLYLPRSQTHVWEVLYSVVLFNCDHFPGWLCSAVPDNLGLFLVSQKLSRCFRYGCRHCDAVNNLIRVNQSGIRSRSLQPCRDVTVVCLHLVQFPGGKCGDICYWPFCSQWYEARIQKVWISVLAERGCWYTKQMFVSCLQRGNA